MTLYKITYTNPTNPSVGGWSEFEEIDGKIVGGTHDWTSEGYIGFQQRNDQPREKLIKEAMKFAGWGQHKDLTYEIEEIPELTPHD